MPIYNKVWTLYQHLDNFLIGKTTINNNGCIIYTGKSKVSGYAAFSHNNKVYLIHRIVLTRHTGESLKTDKQVHHVCHTPTCINPEHMQWIDSSTHTTITHTGRTKQFCPRGHDTYIVGRRKAGDCLACYSEARVKYQKQHLKKS